MFKPCILASDYTIFVKEIIIVYSDHILESSPKGLEEISIWVDASSSQFKNRYVAAPLCTSKKEQFNITVELFNITVELFNITVELFCPSSGQRVSRQDWRLYQKIDLGLYAYPKTYNC